MTVPTNALTYNDYVTQIATMAVVNTQTVNGIVSSTDSAFNEIIPQMLNYAELRIQRDIDFLQSSAIKLDPLPAGTNYVTYSSSEFKTIDTVNIVTQPATTIPITAATENATGGNTFTYSSSTPYYVSVGNTVTLTGFVPTSINGTYTVTYAFANNFKVGINFGTVTALGYVILSGVEETISVLIPTTKEFIQNLYPQTQLQAKWGVPKYFYLLGDLGSQDNVNLFIAPQPNTSNFYYIKTIGTSWLDSLYKYSDTATNASTQTTYISSYLPDLLIMASMIYISAYQRNFGRQSDDPAMAQSYEAQYKTLLPAANNAEEQKRFQASAWSSSSVPSYATPTR